MPISRNGSHVGVNLKIGDLASSAQRPLPLRMPTDAPRFSSTAVSTSLPHYLSHLPPFARPACRATIPPRLGVLFYFVSHAAAIPLNQRTLRNETKPSSSHKSSVFRILQRLRYRSAGAICLPWVRRAPCNRCHSCQNALELMGNA